MLKKILHRFLVGRHFWRYATFGEIADLYAARMLRMTALHLVGGFIAVYLFQIGFSIFHIALFWGAFYLFKAIVAIPYATLTAWIGPKHSMFVANLLYIPAMVGFALLPEFGPWLLVPILIFEGSSAALYNIGHNVDFSKVKNVKNAGKELAFMNVVEKVTAGLSPVLGGFIAFWFGPAVVLIISAGLFLIAALPLFRTGEPVQTEQRLRLSLLPWRLLRRHTAAHMAYGFNFFTSGVAWSLFITVAVLGTAHGDGIYVVLGIISSVVIFVSLIASQVYGRLIDARHGKILMQFSGLFLSLTHIARGFMGTPVAAAGLNAATEVSMTGFLMPYTRAVFDNADLSGRRIAYVGVMEVLTNTGAMLAALLLAAAAWVLSDVSALKVLFLAAAAVSLLLVTARFPLYRQR